MNKDKFVSIVYSTLRDGNTADFSIKRDNKRVLYTTEDISNIIDACALVVADALKRGESVAIRGFGAIGVHRRAPRSVRKFGSDEWCESEEHYVPKFVAGDALRMAARLYDASRADAEHALDPADYGYIEVDDYASDGD